MRRILSAFLLCVSICTGAALADGDKKLDKSVKVKRDDAKAIAIKEVPGTVIDCDLEKRKGSIFWCIDVKPQGTTSEKKEVRIDANSGKVLSVKVEKDEADDKDSASDKD